MGPFYFVQEYTKRVEKLRYIRSLSLKERAKIMQYPGGTLVRTSHSHHWIARLLNVEENPRGEDSVARM